MILLSMIGVSIVAGIVLGLTWHFVENRLNKKLNGFKPSEEDLKEWNQFLESAKKDPDFKILVNQVPEVKKLKLVK